MRLPGTEIGFYRATFYNPHFFRHPPFHIKKDAWARLVKTTLNVNSHEYTLSARDYRTIMNREGKVW